MTTLTFLGSHFSYEPTKIATTVDRSQTVKYRGLPYEHHQPVSKPTITKGLKYRGIAY